jgi:hypothetical protein
MLSMQWDASLERMANLRRSIRPILTDVPLRKALSEDFPQDCAGLPISGGWGYTKPEAVIFVRDQFPANFGCRLRQARISYRSEDNL